MLCCSVEPSVVRRSDAPGTLMEYSKKGEEHFCKKIDNAYIHPLKFENLSNTENVFRVSSHVMRRNMAGYSEVPHTNRRQRCFSSWIPTVKNRESLSPTKLGLYISIT